VVTSSGPSMEIKGRHFRGRVEVVREKGLDVVNEVDMEKYLAGLINFEISSAWSMEAVKAQAVVARTYAMYQMSQHINLFYDMETSVLDQVYGGSQGEDSRSKQAVDSTRGEILTWEDRPVQAFFHSCCGGMTEDPVEVWGSRLPYFEVKKCPYCSNAPNYFWKVELSTGEIERRLGKYGKSCGRISEIRVLSSDESGRVSALKITGSAKSPTISGTEFRKIIGYGVLKSTLFNIRENGDEIAFSGSGSGHGVGMCQWGAKEMSDQGFKYRQILGFYYKDLKIKKAY